MQQLDGEGGRQYKLKVLKHNIAKRNSQLSEKSHSYGEENRMDDLDGEVGVGRGNSHVNVQHRN